MQLMPSAIHTSRPSLLRSGRRRFRSSKHRMRWTTSQDCPRRSYPPCQWLKTQAKRTWTSREAAAQTIDSTASHPLPKAHVRDRTPTAPGAPNTPPTTLKTAAANGPSLPTTTAAHTPTTTTIPAAVPPGPAQTPPKTFTTTVPTQTAGRKAPIPGATRPDRVTPAAGRTTTPAPEGIPLPQLLRRPPHRRRGRVRPRRGITLRRRGGPRRQRGTRRRRGTRLPRPRRCTGRIVEKAERERGAGAAARIDVERGWRRGRMCMGCRGGRIGSMLGRGRGRMGGRMEMGEDRGKLLGREDDEGNEMEIGFSPMMRFP